MKILTACAACLALALPAAAQTTAPQAAGPAGELHRPGTLLPELAEVRAGPGEAYVSRGRVYLGDPVMVVGRDETGGWLEVEGGGLHGWLRTRDVELRGDGVRRRDDGATDAGRDRRETNYRYDAHGRRVGPDGLPAGSGEGTDHAVAEDAPPASAMGPSGQGAVSVRLGLAAAALHRSFQSNIGEGSALQRLSASPQAYGVELAVDWLAHRFVALHAMARDLRFAETTIPASAELGFDRPITMAAEAQEAALDVVGRYPILDGWAGVYVGGHLLRAAYQKTSPFPLLLTDLYVGAGFGGAAGWRLGPVDVSARGGLTVPFLVSQDPADSGDASASGYTVSGEVAWTLVPGWAVVAGGHVTSVSTDFTGESSHQDPVTRDPPAGYDRARATDRVVGGGLGVRWTP